MSVEFFAGVAKNIFPPRPLVRGLSHPNCSLLRFSAPLALNFNPPYNIRLSDLGLGVGAPRSEQAASAADFWVGPPGQKVAAAPSENPAGEGGAKTAHFLIVPTSQNARFCSERPLGRFGRSK